MPKTAKKNKVAPAVKGGSLVSAILRVTGSALASKGVSSYVTSYIPTGFPPLDSSMGGGIPVGRLTEIYGDESSGKSTLGFSILAQAQKMGGTAILIETEHALERNQLLRVGIDPEKLVINSPESLEGVLQTVEDYLRVAIECNNKVPILLVFDSLAASSPDREVGSNYADSQQPGTAAKLLSLGMRKIVPMLTKANAALVIINQKRDKIGVSYGEKSTTPGGRAIRFYATFRLAMRRLQTIKSGDTPTGIMSEVFCAKSKITNPFWRISLPIMFQTGIDAVSGALSAAITDGVVRKRGRNYYYDDKAYSRVEILQLLKEGKIKLDDSKVEEQE